MFEKSPFNDCKTYNLIFLKWKITHDLRNERKDEIRNNTVCSIDENQYMFCEKFYYFRLTLAVFEHFSFRFFLNCLIFYGLHIVFGMKLQTKY